MKGELIKVENGYVLMVNNIMYATDNDKLSKKNCDEIFGVVDVEKLAESHAEECYERNGDPLEESYFENRKYNFKEGFNKAMELNKDKLFTVEDIKKAFNAGWVQRHNEEGSTISNTLISIATEHPPGICVRITMSCSLPNGCTEPGIECTCDPIPALDENGCLILWVLNI